MDDFTEGYIECMLWTEEAYNLGEKYPDDIAESVMVEIRMECESFQKENKVLLEKLYADKGMVYAGHDFWLTRNGHGAGFWDRGFGKDGDILTKAAKAYGPCDAYVGDDGKVYIS